MKNESFVYATYIRTTPEKLWEALTQPEFTRRYWMDSHQESDWKLGSSWRLVVPGGKAVATGKIVEMDPPRHLVFTWRNEKNPEAIAEGYSRATYVLEKQGDLVKLTIIHEMEKPGSILLRSVANGWPLVLASLKTFLETGEPLPGTSQWVPCEN